MSSRRSSIAVLLSVYDNEGADTWLRARRAQLFADCLESVISAKRTALAAAVWSEIKIFVVDDGSQPPISENAFFESKEFEVIRLDQNVGQAAALSVALRQLSMDYVAFTDSDCIVGHHWLKAIGEHYDRFPHHCGVGGPNWIHKLPGGIWGNWVNRQESALMRYSIERYIDFENQTTERIDCRNVSFRVSELAALTQGEYFAVVSGPSVSNQFSHFLRPRLQEHGCILGFSESLPVTHTSVPGLWQQMRSYYDRSRRGNYRCWYGVGKHGLVRSFFRNHFKRHFWDPVVTGKVSFFYVVPLHVAYWLGVLRQNRSNGAR